MKKIKERIDEWSGKWWILISSLIIGLVLGAGLFSFFVIAPKGLENWLSAVGTVSAVVVSLYLSLRKPKKLVKPVIETVDYTRININLTKSSGRIDWTDFLAHSHSLFEFVISNKGTETLVIKSVYFKFGNNHWYLKACKNSQVEYYSNLESGATYFGQFAFDTYNIGPRSASIEYESFENNNSCLNIEFYGGTSIKYELSTRNTRLVDEDDWAELTGIKYR